MTTHSDLLKQYESASDRIWFIRELEASSDPLVDKLFAHLLGSDAESEVKVEILRTLEIRSVSPDTRDLVARAVVDLLNSAGDEVLQQHSATTLRSYWDSPGVLAALHQVVSDRGRDEDVRFNAVDSMAAHIDYDEYRKALESLSQLEDEIGDEVRVRVS